MPGNGNRLSEAVGVGVAFLTATCGACHRAPAVAPSRVTISAVCTLDAPVRLEGTAEFPLFGAMSPLLGDTRIYVPDYLGHRILVYDTSGVLLRVLGAKGKEQGQFEMPYGVALDADHNLYVLDRGNRRIQVFDSTFALIRVVTTSGQNEQLFVLEHPRTRGVVVQGATRCTTEPGCLLTLYDRAGGRAAVAGRIPAHTALYTWRAAVAPDNRIYLANMLGGHVDIFSPALEQSGSFELRSPSMRPLRGLDAPETPAAMAANGRRLREEAYSRILSLAVVSNLVLVQIEQFGGVAGPSSLVMDAYDLSGHLRHFGIPTPGILHASRDGLHFVSTSDSGYGAIALARCRREPWVRTPQRTGEMTSPK